MTVTEVQQCPFCPEFLPGQPELWERVQPGMQIDDIPACGGCRAFAGYTQNREYIGSAANRIKARKQDASVVCLDEPEEHGTWRMSWKVTMPEQEYDARLGELRRLRAQAEKAEGGEEMELALEQFLHETE